MTDATTGPRWSRRDVLRRTAAVATGGTLAAHTINESPRLSPVGRADALAFSTAVTLSLAVGAAGGAAVAYWRVGGDTDVDPDDVAENNIHNAAKSVAQGREEFEAQMQAEFVDPSNAEATPFGRAAWQAIRTEAAKVIVNGGQTSEAETSGAEALDDAFARSVVNLTERWNTGLNALTESIALQVSEGVDTLMTTANGVRVKAIGNQAAGHASPVEATNDGNGNYAMWEVPLDTLPVDVTRLDDRDNQLSAFAVGSADDVGNNNFVLPKQCYNWVDQNFSNHESPIESQHSSLSNVVVLDAILYSNALEKVQTAYDNISGKLSTYVQNLHDAIEQGAVDPADILSPNDLVQEFANSEGQARLAAELAAIGAHVPDEAGYRAKVSHPDLQANSVWGHLFPQYPEGTTPTPIQPGTTINSADYTMAYFGYQGESSGEFENAILSGDSNLQILDVEGVDGQQDVSGAGDAAGASGKVVVYSGDSPPDPLANPGNHTNWTVLVQGETNKHTAAVSNVTTDSNGDFVLSSTSLTDGESIDYVELVPPVNQSRPHDYTADETNIDTEQTKEQIKALRQQQEDLEEALNSGGGGGGGSILPDFGGGVGPLVGLVALGGGAWALIQSANN